LARNAKNKIRRTEKKFGIDLSNEITIPKLEDIKSRADFNAFKDQVKKFTNVANRNYQFVKNEHGVVASKKEIADFERATKQAQREVEKKIKEIARMPVKSKGKQITTVGQVMSQLRTPEKMTGIAPVRDFDFDNFHSREAFEEKKKTIEEKASGEFYDKKMQLVKENFMLKMERSFNSDADELIERLKSIPAEDFYELFLQNEEFKFEPYYTNQYNHMSHDEQIGAMEKILDMYDRGDFDRDLQGF
jgi:hypothetical protein